MAVEASGESMHARLCASWLPALMGHIAWFGMHLSETKLWVSRGKAEHNGVGQGEYHLEL